MPVPAEDVEEQLRYRNALIAKVVGLAHSRIRRDGGATIRLSFQTTLTMTPCQVGPTSPHTSECR